MDVHKLYNSYDKVQKYPFFDIFLVTIFEHCFNTTNQALGNKSTYDLTANA